MLEPKEKVVLCPVTHNVEMKLERSYEMGDFKLTVLGETSTGRSQKIILTMPSYFAEYLASQLWDVHKQYQKNLDDLKGSLKGEG